MKTMAILATVAALIACPAAIAQESIAGNYSGSYQNKSGRFTIITLDIKSVENGVVKGIGSWRTTSRSGGPCLGNYPFTGTFQDGKLDVKSDEKGGKGGDCDFRVRATVEGGQLKARFGQNEFIMSR